MKIIPSVVVIRGNKFPWDSTSTTFNAWVAIILLGVLASSCLGGKTTTSSSTANASGFIRYYWNTNSFPLSMRLSDAFSANDVTEITSTVNAWEAAGNNIYNFYNVSTTALNEGITNYSQWRSAYVDVYYYDEGNGNSWPSGLSSSALAVTVNYGFYQGGNAIRLSASSIGVNGVGYNFCNETINGDCGAGEYSLQYVLAHEIGHSLGVGHITTVNSLMEPYVSIGQEYNDVANDSSYGQALDDVSKAYIMGIYGLSMDAYLSSVYSDIVSDASNLMSGLTPDHLIASNVEPGDVVQIAQELMPDGTCIHKLNGVEFHQHKTKLKGHTKH